MPGDAQRVLSSMCQRLATRAALLWCSPQELAEAMGLAPRGVRLAIRILITHGCLGCREISVQGCRVRYGHLRSLQRPWDKHHEVRSRFGIVTGESGSPSGIEFVTGTWGASDLGLDLGCCYRTGFGPARHRSPYRLQQDRCCAKSLYARSCLNLIICMLDFHSLCCCRELYVGYGTGTVTTALVLVTPRVYPEAVAKRKTYQTGKSW